MEEPAAASVGRKPTYTVQRGVKETPDPTQAQLVVGFAILGAMGIGAFWVLHAIWILLFGTVPGGEALARLPEAEHTFVEVVQHYHKAFDDAGTDFQKGAARTERARYLCSVTRSNTVTNWQGTITNLSSNNSGKGVVGIALSDGVSVTTWNNEISDAWDHTLVEPGSALYDTLSSLSEGSRVTFSGFMFPGSKDCFKEASVTQRGSMTEPEFVMRFSRISTGDR